HRNRDALARMFGRSSAAVVLKEGSTGGGFGIRGELYPEDFLVCLATLRLARPVKWIEDRREHLMAANHSRQQRHQARVAVDAAGMLFWRPLQALGTEIVYDSGDYALLLDKALAQIGWEALQGELKERRAAGDLVGAGIGIFVDKGGLGPLDGTRISVDVSG